MLGFALKQGMSSKSRLSSPKVPLPSSPPSRGARREREFEVTVYLEDVDAGGIVYHANYLKYAERARHEWLKARGVGHGSWLMETGEGVIVAEAALIYRKPAKVEDVLAIDVRIANISAASALIEQTVSRGADVIAEIKVKLVYVNDKGKPTRWPDAMKKAFSQ